MTDRTEAMDNLIAQDADLIENRPDDLVQRLRRTWRKEFAVTGSMCANNSNRLRPFPILATEVLFNPDGREAADYIEAQAAEIDRLKTLIDATAEHWMTLQFKHPIKWEGAIDEAMAAACAEIEKLAITRQPAQSDALQAAALDFGHEIIFSCAGLRNEPINTEDIFSITWDGFSYDVTIRAALEETGQ